MILKVNYLDKMQKTSWRYIGNISEVLVTYPEAVLVLRECGGGEEPCFKVLGIKNQEIQEHYSYYVNTFLLDPWAYLPNLEEYSVVVEKPDGKPHENIWTPILFNVIFNDYSETVYCGQLGGTTAYLLNDDGKTVEKL